MAEKLCSLQEDWTSSTILHVLFDTDDDCRDNEKLNLWMPNSKVHRHSLQLKFEPFVSLDLHVPTKQDLHICKAAKLQASKVADPTMYEYLCNNQVAT